MYRVCTEYSCTDSLQLCNRQTTDQLHPAASPTQQKSSATNGGGATDSSQTHVSAGEAQTPLYHPRRCRTQPPARHQPRIPAPAATHRRQPERTSHHPPRPRTYLCRMSVSWHSMVCCALKLSACVRCSRRECAHNTLPFLPATSGGQRLAGVEHLSGNGVAQVPTKQIQAFIFDW